MTKLLKAGFFRLRKEIVFWLFIFLSIGIGVFNLIRRYSSGDTVLDFTLTEFVLYIGLFIAIFVSIFVGKEHSEGIIRNKIIVGHSRVSIYFSNLIISFVASLLCLLAYIAVVLLIGIPMYGWFQAPVSDLLIVFLDMVLIVLAFCSIYNFIAMICSEITVSTTVCIVLFIAMFIVEASFNYTANTNKYITGSYWEDGVEYIISQELNPNYPGDLKVKIARTICLLIPEGQAQEILSMNSEYLYQMPIYSIILIAIINVRWIMLIF